MICNVKYWWRLLVRRWGYYQHSSSPSTLSRVARTRTNQVDSILWRAIVKMVEDCNLSEGRLKTKLIDSVKLALNNIPSSHLALYLSLSLSRSCPTPHFRCSVSPIIHTTPPFSPFPSSSPLLHGRRRIRGARLEISNRRDILEGMDEADERFPFWRAAMPYLMIW